MYTFAVGVFGGFVMLFTGNLIWKRPLAASFFEASPYLVNIFVNIQKWQCSDKAFRFCRSWPTTAITKCLGNCKLVGFDQGAAAMRMRDPDISIIRYWAEVWKQSLSQRGKSFLSLTSYRRAGCLSLVQLSTMDGFYSPETHGMTVLSGELKRILPRGKYVFRPLRSGCLDESPGALCRGSL